MAAPTVRKMHTTGARIFFLRALNQLLQGRTRGLSPRSVSALPFFPLAQLLQVLRRPCGRARAPSPPPHRGRARHGFSLMSVEWDQLFGLSVPPLELVVRGSAMYLFLWLVFRVLIKRRVGATRPSWS